MSGPVEEADEGPSTDGPLHYAPKKARHPESEPNPRAPIKGDVAPPASAWESAEPPWKRSKQDEVFADEVALAARRASLALAPDRLPEPPPPPSRGPRFVLARRLAGVAVVAAVGVVGYHLGSARPTPSPRVALRHGAVNQQGLASNQSTSRSLDNADLDAESAAAGPTPRSHPTGTTVNDARGATAANAVPVADPPEPTEFALASPAAATEIVPQSDGQKSRDAALAVGAVRPQLAGEAARLAVSAADAGADAAVEIGGLAPGSTLSAGTQVAPDRWRLSVEELASAAVTPPRGFVGTMDLTLDLRVADNAVADHKGLQLEWSGKNVSVPTKAQHRQGDTSELALMMKTGAEFMANGDISSARLLYRRAAEAGEAMAAFALAETYDPLMLRKLTPKGGIRPDIGLAQSWYEKAKDLGSTAASERLERLARLPE